jgi:hypothetical protein
MPIDTNTQVSASVILDKEVYEIIRKIAKENKRSASSQMAYILEEYIKAKEDE